MPEPVASFSISDRRILLDGEPAFILADTVWSIVGDATDDELAHYLQERAVQGFNAVLFSILPIPHDRVRRKTLSAYDEATLLEGGRWRSQGICLTGVPGSACRARSTPVMCGR